MVDESIEVVRNKKSAPNLPRYQFQSHDKNSTKEMQPAVDRPQSQQFETEAQTSFSKKNNSEF